MSFGGITRWAGIVAAPLAKLSMVAKGSFLDLGPLVNLAQYADGEHVAWITDPAGKTAQANLDRPGTGETLSGGLANGTFTGWTGGLPDSWTIVSPQSGNNFVQNASPGILMSSDGTMVSILQSASPSIGVGALSLATVIVTGLTGAGVFAYSNSGTSLTNLPSAGTYAKYGTSNSSSASVSVQRSSVAVGTYTATLSLVSLAKVSAPSLTGAWAIRRRDGQATFEREDTGFARNAASYRVEIAYQPRAERRFSIPGVSPNLLYPGRPMRRYYIPVSISQDDALNVAASEGVTEIQGALARTDALTARITEGTTGLSAFLARADSLGLTITETAALLAALSRIDALAVATTEGTTSLLASLSRSDVLSVSVADADTIAAFLSRSDTLRVGVDSISAVTACFALVDTLRGGITDETTALDVLINRADTLGIELSDLVLNIAVFLSLADALGITLSDYLAGAVLGVPVSTFTLEELPPRYILEEQPARFALEEMP